MNNVNLIREEFPKQFQDVWKERGNGEEGIVQNKIYTNSPTHCRSTMWTFVKILKARNVLEIGSWKFDAANMMGSSMDEHCENPENCWIDSLEIMPGGYDGNYVPPKSPRVKEHYWYPMHTNYDEFKYMHPNIVYKEFRQMSNTEIFLKNCEILDSIKPERGWDIILIDGDHSYDGVSMDFEYAKKYARPDTVICIDDLCDDRHWQVKNFYDQLQPPTISSKYNFDDWNAKSPHLLSSIGICQIG